MLIQTPKKKLIEVDVTIDSNSRVSDGTLKIIGFEDGDIALVLGERHIIFESKLAFENLMVNMYEVFKIVHQYRFTVPLSSTEVTSVRIGEDYEHEVGENGPIFHQETKGGILEGQTRKKKKEQEKL